LKTQHENAIVDMRDASPAGNSGGALSRISSVAHDGRLVLWDLTSLDVQLDLLHL
jgi:hypothetical protein